MHTVVQVWAPSEDAAPPSALTEATALADRAAGAEPAACGRLLALRVALVDRYPLRTPEDDVPSVWADETLAAEREGPSWDIAIAPAAAFEVRPYVIAQALRFGLHARDRESGDVHLAGGEVFSRDDRGPCVIALAAWRQGDVAAAHDALCLLAEGGNGTALWHLGTLYDEAGGFVQCNAVIACALFGAATSLHACSADMCTVGASAPFDRVAFTRDYRRRIGPEMAAAADALQPRLSRPGELRRALREAGGERDIDFALGLEALARGDLGSTLARLQPLAERGHLDARRTLVRLWASGEAQPMDPMDELDWMRDAAAAGDDAGMAGMAALLEEGVLVPRDAGQAAHWLRRLVRRGRTGHAREQARVGLARLASTADVPAAESGASWREAAGRREPEALLRLGRACAFASGPQPDRVAAQALFVLARRHGARRAEFLGSDDADPNEVRRLLSQMNAARDLVGLLESRRDAREGSAHEVPSPRSAIRVEPFASAIQR